MGNSFHQRSVKRASTSPRATALLYSVGLIFAGCESKPALGPDALVQDAGADGQLDGDTDASIYPIAVNCEEPCRVRYRELEPFDMPIDHHTTFILERPDGAYLYVVGGITVSSSGEAASAVNRRISSAKIREDGSLEPWQHEDFSRNLGVAFHAQLVGNANDPTKTQGLVWGAGLAWTAEDQPASPALNTQAIGASFAPESVSGSGIDQVAASVGEVRPLKLPGFGLLHSSLARTANGESSFMHYIGGAKIADRQEPTAEVWSVNLGVQGTSVARSVDLPETRSHHGVVLHNNTVYVLGGFGLSAGANVARDAVLRARIGADGNITSWDRVGTLDDAPWTFGTFEHEGYIYIAGGGHEMADMHHHDVGDAGTHDGSIDDATVGDATILDAGIVDSGSVDSGHNHDAGTGHVYMGGEPGYDGNPFIARVRRARILEDGTLSAFEDVNPLPARRSHVHQTPNHGRFFYSVGGRQMRGTTRVQTIDRVFVGEIL